MNYSQSLGSLLSISYNFDVKHVQIQFCLYESRKTCQSVSDLTSLWHISNELITIFGVTVEHLLQL